MSAMFTWAQKLAWRWDRPWLTNYQLIIHVDGASSISDVFNAKSDIQEILDNKNVTIKGYKLEAKVEQTQERKKWLSIYFNNVRAIEKTTGSSAMKNGATWHLETRTFSIFHLDHPEEAIGKLNKETLMFEYDSKVLDKIDLKEADIRDNLS
jgi:predicted  nucleic acid-binding Zn ribbon protein